MSPANVRADFRMTPDKGRERDGWNIPWRSATRQDAAGWTAELALPWCLLLTHGDPAQARFNLIVVTFTPVRDKQAVQLGTQRDKASWAPLRTAFNEPRQFGRLRGLDAAAVRAPFLPFLTAAQAGPYETAGSGYAYPVSVGLETLSGRTGAVALAVTDQPEGGPAREVQQALDLPGNATRSLRVPVPATALVQRTALVRLLDPATGEEWQRLLVDDTAVLDLFSCYLDRNYYTTEPAANAVCRIGLPPDGLKGLLLRARAADGTRLAERGDLTPASMLPIPLPPLPAGTHTVAVELCQADGRVATRQALTLVKRPARPGAEVKVDRVNRILLHNGIPMFPYGFVMRNIRSDQEWAFRDVGAHGFTGIAQWGSPPPGAEPAADARAYLEMAARHGLAVVLAPDMAYHQTAAVTDPDGILSPGDLAAANTQLAMHRGSLTSWKGMLANGARLRHLSVEHKGRLYFQLYEKQLPRFLDVIRAAATAPNLIGHYMLDEPLILEINQDITGRHYYGQVHAADGYHPVFILYSSEIPETPRAVDWCDALGTDPYWIPGGDHRNTVNWVAKIVANTRRRADAVRAVTFTVPMAEYWSACRQRVILPAEQRCQTYLALIHGSRGIFYFLYPVMTQPVFDTLTALAAEMKTLGPVCLTPDVAQQVAYDPGALDPIHDRFTDVQVSLKRHPDGGFVLLAANTAAYPVETAFTLSLLGATGSVGRLFAPDTCAVSNGTFAETLEGHATRAYRLAGREPAEGQPIAIRVAMTPRPGRGIPDTPALLESNRAGKKNLLPNSSFEQVSVPGWPDYYRYTGASILPHERIGSPTAVFGADTNRPYHGKVCLFLDGGTNKNRIAYFEPTGLKPLTEQPRPFVFSAWMRGNRDGVKALVRIGLVIVKQEFTLTTEWQRVSLVAPLPAGADETVIWMHNDQNRDGDRLWIDAVQFEPGDQPTAYEP